MDALTAIAIDVNAHRVRYVEFHRTVLEDAFGSPDKAQGWFAERGYDLAPAGADLFSVKRRDA